MLKGCVALCILILTGTVVCGYLPKSVLEDASNGTRNGLATSSSLLEDVLEGNNSLSQDGGIRGTKLADDREAEDCVPPSIDEFPRDLFSNESRQSGALVLHFLAVAYLCCALAIVCDEYFVPCLELLSRVIRIPTDVAGATVMAIGTSSPELYSAIIGSFITKGDIGLGTIVGSAVFNILGVTSVTGLCLLSNSVQLEWYPILRDFIIYVVCVTLLAVFIYDSTVHWYEAGSLLTLFVFYIAIMFFNAGLKRAATKQVDALIRLMKRENGSHLNTKNALARKEIAPLIAVVHQNGTTSLQPQLHKTQEPSGRHVLPTTQDTTEQKAGGHSTVDVAQCSVSGPLSTGSFLNQVHAPENHAAVDTKADASSVLLRCGETTTAKTTPSTEDEVLFVPFTTPSGGWLPWVWWLVTWPAACIFFVTVPNCKRFPRLFPATFVMSVLWIGILSYLCAWMVTVIGYTLNVPDSVSGLTILAAGISVPEIITSVLIVKMGFGNMAISNLLGSNILDILFCLGLPWLVKTCASGPLHINSGALTYTTLTLLATTVLMVVTLCAAGWRLNLKVGLVCLLLYAAFIVLACLYELNVFGDFNPPTCELQGT
ncbi:sodium/potassium/calcium exchanger 5-like isoform X2 [Ornithodoros turicata]|uniref:sodium/potassium/calcium exchanger 5-like isoform X2 n=1 Tax=Ornithodoros turicata TaxID=34597 RepID=UPI003138B20D